jgi:hypothetical protein
VLLLSIVVYTGALLLIAGSIAIVWPLTRLGLSTRGRALGVVLAGAGSILLGCLWPTPLLRSAAPTPGGAIDAVMPAYHFVEHHETFVQARPEEIARAIKAVTPREIRFFRLLTWIRNPRVGQSSESILAAPADKSLLDVALASGFELVGEVPDAELVIGTRVAPTVRAVMNFRIVPDGAGGSQLSTETRVRADDRSSVRGFAVYWRLIYPGSALIRIEWLRAIKQRAERDPQ